MATETPLERKYDLLAEAIDRVPEDRVDLFLTKLALLLGEKCSAPEFEQLVKSAEQDLEPPLS